MSAHGVYVHIPWCRRRCPYCAFYVEADHDVPWDAFVDALLREQRLRAPDFPGAARTVYLGGGTPSRLPAHALRRLLAGLERAPDAEVTAEVNPEDANDAWLDAAQASGVNRVSLGLQTFDERFARLLNRNASVRQAREVARRIGARGLRSWSVDVIFALPGQSVDDLQVDLDAILEVEPPHVSIYGLTYEEGTPLTRARDLGKLTPVDDDIWRAQYDLLVDRFATAGLRRYEVSNFARPGHESQHNRGYWRDVPYMGLGPSAHGYTPDGARYVDVADAAAYLVAHDPTAERERPTGLDAAADLVVSAIRGVEGLPPDALARHRAALDPSALTRLLATGLVERRPNGWLALTEHGFPVADAVTRHLVAALCSAEEAGSG